jgi:hypothetical protein
MCDLRDSLEKSREDFGHRLLEPRWQVVVDRYIDWDGSQGRLDQG